MCPPPPPLEGGAILVHLLVGKKGLPLSQGGGRPTTCAICLEVERGTAQY